MKIKKKLALILAMSLVVSMAAACGAPKKDTASDATKQEDTAKQDDKAQTDNAAETTGNIPQDIAVQIGPDPETLDPALNSAVDGGNMLIHAFETLLIFDKDNKLVGGQAEKYDVSDDGLTYTFTLRDGLKWSDGSDFTAEDFVYTFRRVVDPKTAAPYAYDLTNVIKGYQEVQDTGDVTKLAVSAPDPKTFVVELAHPLVYFDKICAFSGLSPVKKDVVEADPENKDKWATSPETYISNGAVRMKEWVPGSHILFEKNPYYRDADNITLNTLKFAFMEDSNASYSAYNSGELLMIKDVPTEEIPALSGRNDFFIEPIMGTYYISMNMNRKPFDNPKVREALNLAIDRDYVANTIMQGTYTPATNFVGPGISDAEGGSSFQDVTREKYGDHFDLSNYEANVEKAKKLLAEAGYPNGEGFPTIEYMTNDAGYHKPVAEYLQSEWKQQLGIDMSIKIVEWGSFTPTRRNGDYDIARNGWVCDYDDPSNIINLFETGNGNNDGKFSDPEFDAMIEKARDTSDVKVHYEKLHEAEQIMLNKAANIPLAYYNDFYLQNAKLQNTWHSPYGYWYFMYGKIVE